MSAIEALYTSPRRTHTFSLPLQEAVATPQHTTQEKTAHLAELRTQCEKIQAEINAYLTSIMMEEKEAPIDEKEEEEEAENEDEEEA